MPRLNWHNLSFSKRQKLADRVRRRVITAVDLRKLQEWIESDPVVPDGDWCKDFGSFKVVGRSSEPSTFLTKDQACWGERL